MTRQSGATTGLALFAALLASRISSASSSSHHWPSSLPPAVPSKRIRWPSPGFWGSVASAARQRKQRGCHVDCCNDRISRLPRGGAAASEDDEQEDEYDEEEEEESEYDEEEEDEEEEEEDEYDDEEEEEEEEAHVVDADDDAEYDKPLIPSPLMSLYVSFGVMMLARRVDMFQPAFVRTARFLYIGYLVLLQLFVFFVQFKAKEEHDLTPVTLQNPFSSVLQSQFGGGDDAGGGMVKNLASSFLQSKSTVMDYDMKQARNMQGGLIFGMLFLWFLHFKMGQVQPLLIQTFNGLINLVYSPLFQVYVLGRNLERPFNKMNPALKPGEEEEEEDGKGDEATTKTEQHDDDSSLLAATEEVDKEDSNEMSDSDEGDEKEEDIEPEVSDDDEEAELDEESEEVEEVDEGASTAEDDDEGEVKAEDDGKAENSEGDGEEEQEESSS